MFHVIEKQFYIWYTKLEEVIFMARYKVVKPIDREKELKKKRERIRITIDAIYVTFMIIAILIGGLNQFNNIVVGLVMIVIGIGSIPVAIFHVYIIADNWEPVFWYERYKVDLLKNNRDSEKEKLLSEYRSLRAFEAISCVLFSLIPPVFGILRILGIV